MALNNSTQIITSGLTFLYDMNNSQKSWKGQPTTNLVGDSMSIYNNVPGDVTASLATTGEYYKGANIYKLTLTPTTSTGVSYLTGGNNPGLGVVSNGGGGTANRYTGHSIFFKPTVPMSSSPIFTHYSNISGWQSSTNYYNMNDGWYRAHVIWYDTVTRSDGKYWAINPLTATLNVPIITYFAGPFKEDRNDSAYVSQYNVGTRSNTQVIKDLTGNNTITASSLTYNSNGTFSFNGTNNYIIVPNSANLNPGNGSFSIVCWVNSDPSNAGDGWDLWIAKRAGGGSNGYYVGANSGSGVRFMLGNDAGSRTDTAFIGYTFNTWAMFTAILNRTTNTQTIIRNNYDESASTTPSGGNYTNVYDLNIGGDVGVIVPAGQYYTNGSIAQVMIYNRALSATEVSQNFNALRGRYGI